MIKPIILFFAMCLIVPISYGQDGSYNQGFASNGIFQRVFSAENLWSQSFIELEDASLLLKIKGDHNYFLKLSEDGILDESFGDNGILTIDNPMLENFGIQYAQENQKLIISFTSTLNGNLEVTFARISLDGTIDPTFGDNGLMYPFAGEATYGSGVILDDHSFLISGFTNVNGENVLTFKKFTPGGMIDVTYGNNGSIYSNTAVQLSGFKQLRLDITGRIVLNAKGLINGIETPLIARFESDGMIDVNFGENGVVPIPVGSEYDRFYIAVFQNGEIAISSRTFNAATDETTTKIVKILSEGTTDITFGNGGEINLYGQGKLIVQPNQRLLYLGAGVDWEGGQYLGFKRYFQNGTEDSSFNFEGPGGYILESFNTLLRSNGDLTVGGYTIWYQYPSQTSVVLSYNNSPLSVEENFFGTISVYPNPSEGIFTLQTNGVLTDLDYRVFDVSGKLLQTGQLDRSNTQIDLSEVSNGVYFLNIDNQTIKLLKN